MKLKKDFNDSAYLDAFARGLLYDKELYPTPNEFVEFVRSLQREIDNLKQQIKNTEHEKKCVEQQFEVFLTEVGNLAFTYRK